MKRESTLSDYVQDYIDTLAPENDDDLTPEELAESKQTRKMFGVIVRDLISSRETLTDGKLRGKVPGVPGVNAELSIVSEKLLELAPEMIRYFLDEHFTRDLIGAVSGYVERTMQLSRLVASRVPSKITNCYLQEGIRTYILGLPQASVALCRAALEQSLKENLGYQGTRTFVEMNDLLNEAEGAHVINRTIRRMARKIADEADDVLHEKPTSLAKAYEVLVMLRRILQHLYAED